DGAKADLDRIRRLTDATELTVEQLMVFEPEPTADVPKPPDLQAAAKHLWARHGYKDASAFRDTVIWTVPYLSHEQLLQKPHRALITLEALDAERRRKIHLAATLFFLENGGDPERITPLD